MCRLNWGGGGGGGGGEKRGVPETNRTKLVKKIEREYSLQSVREKEEE